MRPLGRPLLVTAGLLWLAAFRELGGATVANGNFFGKGRQTPAAGGIFRLLKNPMYDSYALALIGLGLRRANAVYLLLAGESLLLLNQIEARVENRSLSGGDVAAGRRLIQPDGAEANLSGATSDGGQRPTR